MNAMPILVNHVGHIVLVPIVYNVIVHHSKAWVMRYGRVVLPSEPDELREGEG